MKRNFSALAEQQFDLLIVGGGIYGAWTAYDAAMRGLRVAIVEQSDWASATSSASSKLIHGGLRYLETYDFNLVRKTLTERKRLLELAPHRVWPISFGVPVYSDSRIGMFRMKAGLILYDLLAGISSSKLRHKRFNQDTFLARFPFLKSDELKGGFTYIDGQTDDARLVIELIDGATNSGAITANYCRMEELIELSGSAVGAIVNDELTSSRLELKAKQIVMTSGQWISSQSPTRQWCRLSKGVHLVMPGGLTDSALLLTAKSDGRVFFVIPWYGMTLLGTTDEDYTGDIDNVTVELKEIKYLLEEVNHYLQMPWTENDISGRFAGLRVMQNSDTSSPSSASREWILKTAENGVHYSVGGKLTSAREDAGQIVDKVCDLLGNISTCQTHTRALPWSPDCDYSDWTGAQIQLAESLGIDPESASWLIRRYGNLVLDIFRNIEDDLRLANRIVPSQPFIVADLLWSAHHEMALHLDDLLRRRMPMLILVKLSDFELRHIAELVAPILDWDDTTIDSEVNRCRSQ